MKRWLAGTLFIALVVSMSAGVVPNPVAQQGQAAAQSSAASNAAKTPRKHGTLTVELIQALNSKKLKKGDAVEAKLTGGITLPDGSRIPRNSRVIGHVAEARARSNSDAESSLAIIFDEIVQPGGKETPIKGIILAAAPNPNRPTTAAGVPDSYFGLDEATAKSTGGFQAPRSIPILTEESTGVLGIKNLQLGPNGVFTSSGKEVKLDSGIRMLLDVTVQ